MKIKKVAILILLAFSIVACDSCKDPSEGVGDDLGRSLSHINYSPTTYDLVVPAGFPILELPEDNDLTREKIELGQHLFFDPILSADSTMACVSCHLPELGFTDGKGVSVGIDGVAGTKSSMSLINVAFYNTGLFWDGRSPSLEAQALLPVEDPIELHNNWPGLMAKLQDHDLYPDLFRMAFGIEYSGEMTKEMAAKALASYQRIIVSGNSHFDKSSRNEDVLSDEELEGFDIFFDTADAMADAHCGHCHTAPLFTDNTFRNNGLTQTDNRDDYPDLGYGTLTGNPLDNGKFRTPSLRNISITGPYMHDGRFETLDEVIEHYDSGGQSSPNKSASVLPLGLTDSQKTNLKLFLLTLVDTSYLDVEYLKNPFD